MTTGCKKKPSSSASVIGSNDDLLIEFLVFVPAKSLVQLQLVTKQWQSIISSSSFHRLHTLHFHHSTRSKPQPSFILRVIRGTRYLICNLTTKTLIRFPFEPLNSQYHLIRVIQSRNGLLLLECRVNARCRKHYLVFNPTTMQSRNLNLDKPFHRLFLMFDPHKSPYYRVVCFVNYTRNVVFKSVYDSQTHEWKDVETESKLQKQQVSFAVYWKDDVYFTRSFFVYRVFCPEDGSVDRIGEPPEARRRLTEQTYHESNGQMHAVRISCRGDRERWLFISVLSEDGFSWSEQYSVNLDSISESDRWEFKIGVLGLIKGANEEDSMVVFHVPGKIMVYKFVAETFETVVDVRIQSYFKKDQLQFQLNDVHQLIHTFASV